MGDLHDLNPSVSYGSGQSASGGGVKAEPVKPSFTALNCSSLSKGSPLKNIQATKEKLSGAIRSDWDK